jgi:hypothetical protein
MTVYLVFDNVRYEGSQLLAVYANEEDAQAHLAALRASEHSFDMSFYVSEREVEECFKPAQP